MLRNWIPTSVYQLRAQGIIHPPCASVPPSGKARTHVMDYMSSSGESIQHNAWQSGSSRHVGPVVTNPLLPDADRAEQSARGVNGQPQSLGQWFSKCVPGPVAASPGKCLDRHILGPPSRPTESETGVRLSDLILSPPGDSDAHPNWKPVPGYRPSHPSFQIHG